MYYTRCKQIVEGDKCPICKKPTRQPEQDDICLLTENQRPLIYMLSDVLEQNGIASMKMSDLGAGLTAMLGANTEYTRLYTTFADREKALELADELFNAPPITDDTEAEPNAVPEDYAGE